MTLLVFPTPVRFDPVFEYQDRGIEFMRARPLVFNMDEPGLGKTRQALLAAEGRTLVVAPAVIRDMAIWRDERDLWRPGLDITNVSYHELIVKSGGKWTDTLVPNLRRHWDTVVFDEAHHLKNRKAHWTAAAETLAKHADRVMLLSGTPIPNWAPELFSLLRILRPQDAYRGGPLGAYWRWVQKWFKVIALKGKNGQSFSDWHCTGELSACDRECSAHPDRCIHWEDFRQVELGDLWIRRLRDDVLTELPPLMGAEQLHIVPMVPKQQKAYDDLKRSMLTFLDSGEPIAAWSHGGLLTRLRQISTALEAASDTGVGSGKLDAMMELLEGRSRPTLVVANFRSTLDAIEARLTASKLRWAEISGRTPSASHRRNAMESFQAGRLDVLVGQIETVSEGLTLTAGDMLIIVEHSWRPDKNTQVMRRLHRPGQERPVTVVRLVSPGVDRAMQDLLQRKTDHQVKALPQRDFAAIL